MEINWISDILMPLLSAVIGGLLALLGVYYTLKHEQKERRAEQMDKAKPIVINHIIHAVDKNAPTPKLRFVTGKDSKGAVVTGVFKNTDNGILFIDYIETEKFRYYPQYSSAVDKNTVFLVCLEIVNGETFQNCVIYCHDIFGTPYYYDASFCFESGGQSELLIGNIQKRALDKGSMRG